MYATKRNTPAPITVSPAIAAARAMITPVLACPIAPSLCRVRRLSQWAPNVPEAPGDRAGRPSPRIGRIGRHGRASLYEGTVLVALCVAALELLVRSPSRSSAHGPAAGVRTCAILDYLTISSHLPGVLYVMSVLS